MAEITLSALGNVLTKVIEPTMRFNIYSKSLLASLFFGYNPSGEEVETRKNVPGVRFENNRLYFDIITDLNASVMGYPEDDTLREGRSRDAQGSVEIATVAGMFTITKQVLNMRAGTGVIVDKLMQEQRILERTFAYELSRQLYGDGSGVIAKTASAGSSTTTVPLAASTNGDVDFAEFIPVGSYIKVGSSDVVRVTGKGVNSLTVDTAISFGAGDSIVKVTGGGNNAIEVVGLKAIVGTSAYAGIDPAVEPSWRSYVDNNTGALTVSDLRKAYFKANRIGKVDVIIMNQTLYDKLGSLEEGKKMYTTRTLASGWKGIEWMDGQATIVLDYLLPDDDRIYLLSTDELFAGELQPFEFEKENGQLLYRQSKKLSYEVVASWMGNVGTFVRGAHAVLTGRTA